MTHPIIEEAILRIYANCDGAQSRDNVGFDGTDAKRGARWAQELQLGLPLLPEDQATMLSVAHKYHRQLNGLKLPTVEELGQYLDSNGENIEAARKTRLAEIEREKNKKYFDVMAKYKAKAQEFPQTHPDVFTGLMTLREVGEDNDFIQSLCSRLDGGRDLTDKQQLAARKFIHWISLTGAELENWLDNSTANAVATGVVVKAPGSIELSGNSIVVRFDYNSERHGRIRELLKTFQIPAGESWNPDKKTWNFPLLLAKQVAEAFPEFEVKPGVMEAYEDCLSEDQASKLLAVDRLKELIDLARLDEPMSNGWTYYPYQKDGVVRAIEIIEGLVDENLRGPLWADDMGLGKTSQALTVAAAYQRKYEDKVFVVCPATLKDNWLIEAEIVDVEIEVFSWAKMPEPLEYDRYILICDEAHYAQNSKSARGKQFLKLSQHPNCRAVIPLSGTPMKNGRPINLYPLLKAINHPVAKNSGDYQKRYCAAGYRNIGKKQIWDNSGASHLDELNARIADCMIRRKKKDVLNDLPDKLRVMRKAEVTGERLKGWKKAVAEAQKEYEVLKQKQEETGVETAAKLVLMTRLRVANSIAKVDAAIEYAEEVLEQGEPIVLFTDFVPSAQELYLHLSKQYPCELLTGETPVDERQAMKERFQTGESKVFISTIKAGGVGITLTAASNILLVDRAFTPSDALQAEDRVYRIGQKNNVLATWLQHGEIDIWVDAIIERKTEIIEKVFSGKRKTMRGAKSPNDIVNELLKVILGS